LATAVFINCAFILTNRINKVKRPRSEAQYRTAVSRQNGLFFFDFSGKGDV
jgi:hypothetical protein